MRHKTFFYIDEFCKLPVFTKEEEARAFKQMEIDGSQRRKKEIRTIQKQIENFGKIDLEELKSKLESAQDFNFKVFDEIVCRNIKLVANIAKNFVNFSSKLTILEFISAGNDGLMMAVERFDYQKGHRFSTYACWWIRRFMFDAHHESLGCVKIPRYRAIQYKKLKKIKGQMQKNGEAFADEEIQKVTGMSPFIQKRALEASSIVEISLQSPVARNKEGRTSSFEEIISSKGILPDELLFLKRRKEAIKSVLSLLEDREKEVIIRRFGLKGGKAQTLVDIGKIFNLSREMIRQIEVKALKKLNKKPLKDILLPFFWI